MSARALPCLAIAAVLAAAGCGGDDDGGEKPAAEQPRPPAREQSKVDRAFGAPVPGSRGRVRFIAPSWRRIREVSGSGERTEKVTIDPKAVQWRVRWECKGEGRFEVELPSRPGQPPARGAAACPTNGISQSIQKGEVEVKVGGEGDWRIVIEQQLHDALREPPPPEVASGGARLLGRGSFYRVSQPGRGTAALHRLPNGRLHLRLEGFETLATSGLVIWVSDHPRPRTDKEAFDSKHVEIATLRASAGEQNYLLPRAIRPAAVRSIVIWCKPLRIAYIAAALPAP